MNVNNINKKRYYRFDMETGDLFGPFSKQKLLNILSYEVREEYLIFNHNRVMRPSSCWNYNGSIQFDQNGNLRNIVYYDENFRVLDPRVFMNEIPIALRPWWLYGRILNGEEYPKRFEHTYQYRRDPVPFTGSSNNGPHHSKRCRSVHRIRKQYSDPEYGSYLRTKANPYGLTGWTPFMEDRSNERKIHTSWKNQKKRKQWM